MSALMTIRKAAAAGLVGTSPVNMKSFIDGDTLTHSRPLSAWSFGFEPQTRIDYGAIVGDIWSNSAVQAVINRITLAWPESYPCVKELDPKTGKKVKLDYGDSHPLIDLLEYPSDADDDTVLWAGTILSFWCDGNAYWGINRKRNGDIGEFVYIPHTQISPQVRKDALAERRTSGPDFYEYYDQHGHRIEVPPENIVHYRFGKDPRYPLCGLAPWAAVRRHVFTDNEAINYVSTTLGNKGAAGAILSPKDPNGRFDDPEGVKNRFRNATRGDNRGDIVVMNGATQIDYPPSMKEQGIDHFHRIPETRIAALAGFPAIWVGFASGLERSTYNNTDQAAQDAWNTIVAVQRMMGRQLTQQVLRRQGNFREYEAANSQRRLYAGFDYSEVRALQPDKQQEWERVGKAYDRGLITDTEARGEMGYDKLTPLQRLELKPNPAPPSDPNDPNDPNSADAVGAGKRGAKSWPEYVFNRIDSELAALELAGANGNGTH